MTNAEIDYEKFVREEDRKGFESIVNSEYMNYRAKGIEKDEAMKRARKETAEDYYYIYIKPPLRYRLKIYDLPSIDYSRDKKSIENSEYYNYRAKGMSTREARKKAREDHGRL